MQNYYRFTKDYILQITRDTKDFTTPDLAISHDLTTVGWGPDYFSILTMHSLARFNDPKIIWILI